MTSFVTPNANRFSNFPTVRLWNNSIREALSQGQPNKALHLLRQMKRRGFKPDNFTLLFAAKACSKLSCSLHSKALHAHAVKSGFRSDVFVLTSVSDMYAKCGERIPERDTAAWNSIIAWFSQSGLVDRVLCLFGQMGLALIQSVTVMGLTRAGSQSKNVKLFRAVRSIGIRIGFENDVSLANTWINAYAKCNDLDSAELVFDGIGFNVRTLVTWNSMIEAYSKLVKFLDALDCYNKMLSERFRPDSGTVVSLLSSCLKPEALLRGALVHCHGIQLGCESDISVVNTLMSMYSKCGDVISARRVFDGMRYRTSVSWNVMIGCYAEKQNLDEALGLFRAMVLAGEKPDLCTLLALISGCGQTGVLELGKWIDNYALSNGLRDNTVICNSLIDMYAKRGCMNDARKLSCQCLRETSSRGQR